MIDAQDSRTGVPLLDAVIAAMVAARDEGAARALADAAGRTTDAATTAARARTLAALAEVKRLWRQLDIEVQAARQTPPPEPSGPPQHDNRAG